MSNCNERPAKVLLVTAKDKEDEQRLLSCLTSTRGKAMVINLTDRTRIRKQSSLDQLEDQEDWTRTELIKRRKADLTCVICGGLAFGYNFGEIVCEPCKAFFRRNAWHSIENTKCRSTNGRPCEVRYNTAQKCQRCRLLKCFQSGLRKEMVLSTEAKSIKQQELEANRRLRLIDTSIVKAERIHESSPHCSPVPTEPPLRQLSDADWTYLQHIQQAYLSASRSIPPASSMISVELTADKASAYTNTIDLQNFGAMRVITFLRQMREFEQLHDTDRLILVKYNLNLVGLMHFALTFDPAREIWYLDHIDSKVSPDDEAFAAQCKSLYIVCYGYELSRFLTRILHAIDDIVHKDATTVQLLMLTMIFLKGLAPMDEHEPSLEEGARVFAVHGKFADLLFRYLIEHSSFEVAAKKMLRIVDVLMKIQQLMREFYEHVKSRIDASQINPLMKSLLHVE